jgi:hypothetical protein
VGFGIGKLALLGTSIALTAAVHRGMPSEPRSAGGELFVPRPEVARATALGFDAVIADYYWLQAVQLVGSTKIVEQKSYLLGPLIDVVTTLDPWVDHPYRFAAVWLTDSEASVRKANELLRRGIDHHPGDWRNYFHLGFNHFFYLGEAEPAAEVLERAIDLPNAPRYLRRLLARLKGEAGGLETAEAFLHGLLLEAEDESVREQYEKALAEIATERVARGLDEARQRYRERHGRDIETVLDLTRGPEPVLAALPADPSGGDWTLERYTGEIVSDLLGHRYEIKIDAVNRKRIQSVRESAPGRGGAGGGG